VARLSTPSTYKIVCLPLPFCQNTTKLTCSSLSMNLRHASMALLVTVWRQPILA
jgi:hypothetical protein